MMARIHSTIPLLLLPLVYPVVGAAFAEVAEPGRNLVTNSSFEEQAATSPVPAGWHGMPQVYSGDRNTAKSGKASLKYDNADPKRYVLCTQRVPVQPGWKVRFRVWVKTQDIKGSESGATICLEWQGKDGKWLGGAYPIGRSPASMAAQGTAETFRQVEHARPLWQVPQLHNWANYAKTDAEKKGGRTPTYEEVRSMAWQCICEGATGLVFYSWYDVKRNPDVPFDVQWEGLKRLAAEIDQMAPILLSPDPPPAIRIEGKQPRWLHWLTRQSAAKLYLVVVNDGDGEGTVDFRLPSIPKSVRLLCENRSIQFKGTSLQVELPRLAVRCLEIE